MRMKAALNLVLIAASCFIPGTAEAQGPEAALVEFRTADIETHLKKDPQDPNVYIAEIPANSRIEILYPEMKTRLEPGDWYEVRYLDETGWLQGDEIETVILETGP